MGDPRARHRDRGSGLARTRKQSQAMIVGGVSLEAAPPARQDDAETASIIVNGRKGLYEHGHCGAGSGKQRARARSLPTRHLNMVPRIRIRRQGSCQASAEHFQQCAEFLLLRNRGLGPLAVMVLPIALAMKAAATACAAVQSTARLFRR